MIILLIFIMLMAMGYFGYYSYRSSKILFLKPEEFKVELETEYITVAGMKWLESYAAQYEARYVSRDKKVEDITVTDITVLEDHVVQVDFTVTPKKLSDDVLTLWQGTNENSLISCQWVLWLGETVTGEGKRTYQVTKVERLAAYDLARYQTSGQKDKDEANLEYYGELPFEEKDYTYRIEDGQCSVSYDGGKSFKEVPVDIDVLGTVGDGKSYYNKLQEGSYSISQVKTTFVYGGTTKTPLSITFSDDLGETFVTKNIPNRVEAIRVKFVSFITKDLGYVIVAGDRAMSQEIQVILKTEDGGETWQETGEGPSSWLLQSGGFVEEDLGFLSYPKVEGMETNLYRTIDGGKSFMPIILPEHTEEFLGYTLTPFVQPETPFYEDGELVLLVGQCPVGDFNGGKTMAKYKSIDKGKTFTFVELYEPQESEPG